MTSFNKTFLPSPQYQHRNWFLIDCQGLKLGRLATVIASLLKGKLKPSYHPSIDGGDYIILINTDSIQINESSKQFIVSHPGRPGHSLTIKNASDSLPKFTIERTIKGMLAPTEKKRLMRRLTIYSGETHPHQSQKPILLNPSNLYETFQNNP